MKALGFFAGIGAMLIPAKEQGYRVLANIETRDVHCFEDEFGRNTFEENFKAPLLQSIFDIDAPDLDLLCAQPKCGGFSRLYGTGRAAGSKTEAVQKYGADIISTIDAISYYRPRFFVIENLDKSLKVVTAEMYSDALPDYDIFPEWVSNYHYGNVQKGRNRLFMIGALKSENFVFVPGEVDTKPTVQKCFKDLIGMEGLIDNHDQHSLTGVDNITNLAKGNDWASLSEYIKTLPLGKNLPYRAKDGEIKFRIGSGTLYWDKHSHALAGIKGAKFHPLTGLPISIRERCRIQGYPDDFIIYGTKFNEDDTWELKKNSKVVRQLNNTVPYQFCEYIIRQITAHIKGEKFESSGLRLIKPNDIVTTAKKYFIEYHGYSNHEKMKKYNWF